MPDFSKSFAGRFTGAEIEAFRTRRREPAPISPDDKLFEVTVLSPVSYRIWAPDADATKRKAAILRPVVQSDEPVCVGFPQEITVKEIDA